MWEVFQLIKKYIPCSCLLFSMAMHAVRHSCSSGEGIRPAEPAALSFLACHQLWSSLLIICMCKNEKNIGFCYHCYIFIQGYKKIREELFMGAKNLNLTVLNTNMSRNNAGPNFFCYKCFCHTIPSVCALKTCICIRAYSSKKKKKSIVT